LTPLHTAAELGAASLAELLLEKGADLNHAGGSSLRYMYIYIYIFIYIIILNYILYILGGCFAISAPDATRLHARW
jgi:ankyrin repeat protein